MALHHFRYSQWDGNQDVPDFSADDILETMADDLLSGGDPQRALERLLKRGFSLPDGRRFDGLNRLLRQMNEYRQEAFNNYDPNNMLDRIREQLEQILQMERAEIDSRHDGAADQGTEAQSSPSEENSGGERQSGSESGNSQLQSQSGGDGAPEAGQRAGSPQAGGMQGQSDGQSGDSQSGQSGSSGSPGSPDEFAKMLERMLQRKEEFLDALPRDNAGRIRGLKEYDFLSPEAREAFENLVGGMQRKLMEQYFQGLKEGIGNITPQDLDATRQMVRDLNEMLEASQRGDRGAFDRFMEQYGNYFPPGIESLEQLLEHLQRQSAAMQSLLDSMDPEQRAELEAMMNELLQDDRLRMDLAKLAANLSAMGYDPRGTRFPFAGDDAPGFGQSLDMMNRLQAMEDLEHAMRSGDPFNALSSAGGHDASELFGPQLGGQISAVRDMAESLLEAGYLTRDGDRLSLTARAIRKLGDASLREIFRKLKEDRAGGHAMTRKGHGGDLLQESRPYQFGDPFHVDIKATVMNGVYRDGPGTPVQIQADDFAIFETERAVQHATVLALDMSNSMFQSGLFLEAKKMALALDSLIRGQFPRDALYLIGFSLGARELRQEELPTLGWTGEQGTNYERAFSLSRQLLSRHRGGNRQILFVTDGEPTACMLPNGKAYFHYPAPPFIEDAALMEAARCAKEGITINTFMLNTTPHLLSFVQEMSAINRGRMFPVGPYHLGREVVLDYLHGRTVRRLH